MEELIICPWCKTVTTVGEEENEVQCSICQRIITEEDLEEAVQQEEK